MHGLERNDLLVTPVGCAQLVALGGCASDGSSAPNAAPDAASLWTLAITPSRDSTYVGESVTLLLRATDRAGAEVGANAAATWTSSDPGVATAEPRGDRETVVKAVRPGFVTITAALQGRFAGRAVTILPELKPTQSPSSWSRFA